MHRPPPPRRVAPSKPAQESETHNKRKLEEELELDISGPERKKVKSFVDELSPNPPIVIVQYPLKKPSGTIQINVIRDDLLIAGTKQRAFSKYIEHYAEFDEFVYVGPSSGFAQVGLTISCLMRNKKATLFVVNPKYFDPKLTTLCKKLGAKVKFFEDKISEIELEAKRYVENESNEAHRIMLVPFGLDCPIFESIFMEQLREAVPPSLEPKRMWITVGSGVLIRALAKVFTKTEFMPIKVGKNLWEDQYTPDVWKRIGGRERIDKLAAPQKFFESVPDNLLPPYPSVNNYDAKVWQQVLKHGQDGDYVWNVASDIETIRKLDACTTMDEKK